MISVPRAHSRHGAEWNSHSLARKSLSGQRLSGTAPRPSPRSSHTASLVASLTVSLHRRLLPLVLESLSGKMLQKGSPACSPTHSKTRGFSSSLVTVSDGLGLEGKASLPEWAKGQHPV